MKIPGLTFEEAMSGTYTMTGREGAPRGFSFRGKARTAGVVEHLQGGLATLEGTLDMEDFADDVPIRGTLEIAPLGKRLLRYEFAFSGNDGAAYQFVGEKNLQLGRLLSSWTTLLGHVHDAAGREIARATVRFDLKADLLPFLASFRFG